MSTLKSVAFADYKKANKIVSVHKAVKKSENGLYVTFLTSELNKDGEFAGKPIAKNMWFARTVVESGRVSEGQSTAELDIANMIVCETTNEAGEIREKLAYGAGDYVAI